MRKPLAVTPAIRLVHRERPSRSLVISGDLPEGEALSRALSLVLLDVLALCQGGGSVVGKLPHADRVQFAPRR